MTDRAAHEADFHARARAHANALEGRDEDVSRTWQRGTDADVPAGWGPDATSEAEVRYLRERLDRAEAERDTLAARLAAVEKVAEEGPFLTRWIDGTVLVERADLRAALEGKP